MDERTDPHAEDPDYEWMQGTGYVMKEYWEREANHPPAPQSEWSKTYHAGWSEGFKMGFMVCLAIAIVFYPVLGFLASLWGAVAPNWSAPPP